MKTLAKLVREQTGLVCSLVDVSVTEDLLASVVEPAKRSFRDLYAPLH